MRSTYTEDDAITVNPINPHSPPKFVNQNGKEKAPTLLGWAKGRVNFYIWSVFLIIWADTCSLSSPFLFSLRFALKGIGKSCLRTPVDDPRTLELKGDLATMPYLLQMRKTKSQHLEPMSAELECWSDRAESPRLLGPLSWPLSSFLLCPHAEQGL